MNYKQFIIDALFDANVKPFFSQHIFRKMQEAKKVNYNALEFFTGCANAIEVLEGEFTGQLNDVLVRLEDQLELCRKKGSERAAKGIQEQYDFITEDNFQMQITGYGRLSKFDIDLARRGVADAIELTKGDIRGLVEKVETIRKRKVPLSKIDDPFLLIPDKGKRNIIAMYEVNLQTENILEAWTKKAKIDLCAAFCNKLYEGNFFKKKTLSSAIAFAHGRYGVDISATLDKLRRKHYLQVLNKKENEIMRIATGTKYGKMENRIRQK